MRRGVDVAMDERGVALPLALVTLVLVSSLVVGALVTASLEFAISVAHQESIDAFYRVDGGVRAYLAEHGATLAEAAGAGVVAYVPREASGEPVWIRVVELAALPRSDSVHLRLYSVLGASQRESGRSVAVVVARRSGEGGGLGVRVEAAMALAGRLEIGGSPQARVSGRVADPTCGGGGPAIRVPAGWDGGAMGEEALKKLIGVDDDGVEVAGEAAVARIPGGLPELVAGLSGVKALEAMAAGAPADVRWGARWMSAGGEARVFDGTLDAGEGLAIIDAAGGVVRIEGGEGVAIVISGDVEIPSGAEFTGVIIVEGGIRMHPDAHLVGGVVAMGPEAVTRIDAGGVSEPGADVAIQYDPCAVARVLSAADALMGGPDRPISWRAWQEVVR